jgi:hypothetical protein
LSCSRDWQDIALQQVVIRALCHSLLASELWRDAYLMGPSKTISSRQCTISGGPVAFWHACILPRVGRPLIIQWKV